VRAAASLALLALVLASGCSKSGRVLSHLTNAQGYFASSRYEEAEIEYRNVLRLDPTNVVAVSRMGIIYHDQGRLLPGLLYLAKAKQLDPENLEVRFRLGYSLLAGRYREEARKEAEFILSRNPGHDEALMLFTETAVTSNEIASAFQTLESLPGEARAHAGYYLALATLHYRMRDLAKTEAALKQALVIDPKSSAAHASLGNYYWVQGDLEEADRFFLAAADLAPLRSKRRLRYGEFLLRTGKVEEGRKFIEDITRQTPDYLPAWAELAEHAYEEKDYDACMEKLRHILAKDRTLFDALLLEARVLLAQGQTEAGIQKLENMPEVYGRVPKVLYHLAVAKLVNEQTIEAMSLLEQAVARDPTYADALILKAQIDIQQNRHLEAISGMNQLLGYQPRLAQAHLLLATAYLRNEDPDSALRVYERLDAVYPANPQAPFSMGQVRLKWDQVSQARADFAKALERSPLYIPALEQLVEMDLSDQAYQTARERVEKAMREEDVGSQEPLLHLLLAKIHYAEKNYAEAEAAAKRALELRPNLRPAYMLLTRIAIATGHPREALEKAEALVANDPQDEGAIFHVGMIQESLKEYDAARDAYLKALEINDRYPPALNNLACLYAEQYNDLNRSYDLARKAVQIGPDDPVAADTLGWIHFRRGEYDQALAPLRRSLQKLTREPVVHYHLGMVHYMRTEEDLARASFESALKLDKEFPERADAQFRLERLALDPVRADAALIARLQADLEKEPRDPILLLRLGTIHRLGGKPAEAVALYERVLQIDPYNVDAHVQLATLYATPELDQLEKALSMARKARSLAPSNPAIAGQLGRLARAGGDTVWALPLLQEGVRNNPRDADLLYDLAHCVYALGQVGASLATVDRALNTGTAFPRATEARQFKTLLEAHLEPVKRFELSDTVDVILQARSDYVPALYLAAQMNESRQQFDVARERYRQVLATKGYQEFTPALRSLAILLVSQSGDTDEAYSLATRARDAYPEDADVAKALGTIMYLRREFARAAQLLDQSAKTKTKDAGVFFYLGDSLLQTGRKAEAITALERSLEIDDKSPYSTQALQALAQARQP